MERDENECRKPFAASEAVAMAKLIKGQVEAEAEKRKREGGRKGGSANEDKQASVPRDGTLDDPPSANESRQQIAKAVGS